MKSNRGSKRKVNYESIVAYAAAHPTDTQTEIGVVFGITQSRVSHILRASGLKPLQRGGPLQRKPGMTDDEYKWEKILHDCGLGMHRGLRLHNKVILYGYDPMKESIDDSSATSIAPN